MKYGTDGKSTTEVRHLQTEKEQIKYVYKEEGRMNRLKMIRKSAGITRRELSRITGIHEHSIERHERGGEIDRDRLVLYAGVFQLPIEFIAGTTNDLTGRFDEEERMLDLAKDFSERFKAFNYEQVDKEKKYYLIWEKHNFGHIVTGAYTIWVSNTADGQYEKRVPRLLVEPDRNHFEKAYGKIMVVNSIDEAIAMYCFGGAALIEKELCEEFYPDLFEEGFLVERDSSWIMDC